MILLFGGTTEGRKAAVTLDKAGNIFYYSTAGEEQHVELRHGERLCGRMDEDDMATTCREKDIRLIVDAAHPFASQLHTTIARTAGKRGLPVIRYERVYPTRSREDYMIWCKDYEDAIDKIKKSGIKTLLAATGAKSIRRLRQLEEAGVRCYYRILDRKKSHDMARAEGVEEEMIVYYSAGETENQLRKIDNGERMALLTKEDGLTGGFDEKREAARHLGISLFVVERPEMPEGFITVDGVYGLRREVERLLPHFFPLHSGLTTGTCATAAAIGALMQAEGMERSDSVGVVLPDGETIRVEVEWHDGYAAVTKHAGDDPDVTDGTEIRARVCIADNNEPDGIRIRGGEGIGRITLGGLDYPPGEWAINRVPREMIRHNLRRLTDKRLDVEISAPEGERLARLTFNPRIGIEGGISIIGVTGIVEPYSEESFVESIAKCLSVAKAVGGDMVVINSGAKSESFLRARFPELHSQSFVEYGNHVGKTISMAAEMGFKHVVVGIMIGKAVKLAAGNTDTHSRRNTMDKAFLSQLLRDATGRDMSQEVAGITLARETWTLLDKVEREAFAEEVARRCLMTCSPLLPDGKLTILIIDNEGHIYETEQKQ